MKNVQFEQLKNGTRKYRTADLDHTGIPKGYEVQRHQKNGLTVLIPTKAESKRAKRALKAEKVAAFVFEDSSAAAIVTAVEARDIASRYATQRANGHSPEAIVAHILRKGIRLETRVLEVTSEKLFWKIRSAGSTSNKQEAIGGGWSRTRTSAGRVMFTQEEKVAIRQESAPAEDRILDNGFNQGAADRCAVTGGYKHYRAVRRAWKKNRTNAVLTALRNKCQAAGNSGVVTLSDDGSDDAKLAAQIAAKDVFSNPANMTAKPFAKFG